jgi:hypothetical protein
MVLVDGTKAVVWDDVGGLPGVLDRPSDWWFNRGLGLKKSYSQNTTAKHYDWIRVTYCGVDVILYVDEVRRAQRLEVYKHVKSLELQHWLSTLDCHSAQYTPSYTMPRF